MADDTGYAITSKFDGGNIDLMPVEYRLSAALAPGDSIKFDEFFVTDDLGTVLDFAGATDPPEITDLAYDPVLETIRIAWDSEPGRTYTVRWSPDLSDWTASVASGITSQGTTTSYPPVGQPAAPNPAPLNDALFFRVIDDGPLP